MHKNEMWQTYYPNGEPVKGEGWDSSLDNPDEGDSIIGVAVIFLFRINNEGELELLWQKRSDFVSRYPGFYDISAGGHINLGETLVEGALRECNEEIGVNVRPNELHFVTMRPHNKNRFAWVYAVDWTGKPEGFAFNDKEVSEVRWIKWGENDEFRKKYAKESLRNDELTFAALDEWFRMYGYL